MSGQPLRPEPLALIAQEIQDSIDVKVALRESCLESIQELSEVVVASLQAGNKLILFGNGGSASDAEHIAAELVGRYRAERQGLPAVALASNLAVVSAVANDYGFAEVFARQIGAFGSAGDVALGISTSGNSPNVLRGLEAARQQGLHVLGLTGRYGGKMRALTDACVCVPSDETPRIQEAHILIGHIVCGIVEQSFLEKCPTTPPPTFTTLFQTS